MYHCTALIKRIMQLLTFLGSSSENKIGHRINFCCQIKLEVLEFVRFIFRLHVERMYYYIVK